MIPAARSLHHEALLVPIALKPGFDRELEETIYHNAELVGNEIARVNVDDKVFFSKTDAPHGGSRLKIGIELLLIPAARHFVLVPAWEQTVPVGEKPCDLLRCLFVVHSNPV